MSNEVGKLAAITTLVDTWMEDYGPGSDADRVMGRQVVSIAFLHKSIHDITDSE